MKKSKVLLISLLLAMGTVMGATACMDDTPPDSGSESTSSSSSSIVTPPAGSVTLDKTTAELGVFDTLTLTADATSAVVWSSSNPDVATVDETGKVTPVGVGTVEITATLVDGEESATCSITVTAPTEDIELDASYSELSLEEGKTLKLEPVAYLGATQLAGGEFVYSTADPSIATIAQDGTITAVAAGATSIKVNATLKGIAAKELSIPLTVTAVATHETHTLAGKPSFYANRETEFSLSLEDVAYTEIQSVTIGGTAVEYSLDGKTMKISKEAMSAVVGGENEILINGLTETGDVMITGNMLNVTFAIGTVEEFNAFGDACNVGGANLTPYIYAILTDDIDYAGANFSSAYAGGYFYGLFDGQGHTINNVKCKNGVFSALYGNATEGVRAVLKNVAFTNVLRDTANGGGLLINEINYATIDNVYVSGRVTAYQGDLFGGFGQYVSNATITNSIIHIDMASKAYNVVTMDGRFTNSEIDNVYGISTNSTGKMYDDVTEGLYTSMADFNAAVTEVPQGFNAEYWDIVDGTLIFKTSEQYVYQGDLTVTTDKEGTEIDMGDNIAFTIPSGAVATLVAVDDSDLTGITLENGVVSVGTTATVGAKFKVVASYYDMISGPLFGESSVYTVTKGAEIVNLQAMQVIQNREVGLELDLNGYNLTNVAEVTANGVAVEYTFNEGKLSIAHGQFTKAGENTLVVRASSASSDYVLSGEVLNVTFAIGTVEEFNAWGKAANVGNGANSGADFIKKTSYMYVILTADIDYNNESFARNAYWSGYFYGTFDGQGHTVSNLKVAYGVFGGIAGNSATDRSVVKNVAFVNVDKNETCSGGLLAYTADYATVENVFISGKQTGGYTNTTALGGFIRIVTHSSVINNCVVYFEDSKSNAFAALVPDYTEGSTVSNVYAISATSWDSLLYKNNTASTYQGENSAHYDTLADFKAGVASLPEAFSSDYWTYDETYGLIFTTTLNNIAVEDYAITTEEASTTINGGNSVVFTANGGINAQTWQLVAIDGADLTGISISNGKVTVGSNAADGAKFKVSVSYVDIFTGETYTAESAEYTVSNPATQVELTQVAQVIQNRSTAAEIDLSEYALTAINSVMVGTTALTAEQYSFADGKLTISASALAGMNATAKTYKYALTIAATSEDGAYAFSGSIENVDYAIGTADEFTAFGKYCNVGGTAKTAWVYAIVTNDIDYGGANFSSAYTGGYFYGLFDGQGHTINNVKAVNAVFAGIFGYSATDKAIVKNIAFTNVLRDTANGGALFTNAFTNAEADNVYVTGRVTVYTGGLFGGLVGSFGNNATFSNSVVHVDMASKAYPVVSGEWKNTSGVVSNVYGISANSTGYMYGTVTDGLYTSVDAFKAAVTAVPESFDSSYWTMVNGVLMFKTAEKYAVTELTLTPDVEDTTISGGSTITFTTNAAATLKVEGDTTGITVNGNAVTVGVNAVDGGKFTVVATYTDLVMGTITATSAEYTVSNPATQVELTKVAQAIQNRSAAAEIDLSEYALTAISSVTVGTTALTAEQYSFADGKLTIAASALAGMNATANAHTYALTIAATSASGAYAFSGSIENVDMAIGTVAELDAFKASRGTGTGGSKVATYAYVLLTDDIDYANGDWGTQWGVGRFVGVFDGQGHTISNVKVNYGFFCFIGVTGGARTTVKNVGFVNIEKTATGGSGFLANTVYNADLVDVYLSGVAPTGNATMAGVTLTWENASTAKNLVVVVDYSGANTGNVISQNTTSATISNAYGISANSKGYMYGTVTDGLYTSVDAFKAAVTAIPEGFNTEYWEMREGELIFKTA